MTDHSQQDYLEQQLAALPRDLAPPADLWPQVARGAARTAGRARQAVARPAARRPFAFGAAVALVCVSLAGALMWGVLHDRANRQGPAVDAAGQAGTAAVQLPPMGSLRANGYAEPHDPAYVAARTSLEQTFHERLALLEPGTQAQIQASLAVIRAAHADILKALAAQPSNPVLEQLLESTWHDEFDLYDHVVRSTQPSFARI